MTTGNKLGNSIKSRTTNDRITCITWTDMFTNIKCFDELTSTTAVKDSIRDIRDITVSCITETDRFTNDELTNTTDVTNISFSWITRIDKFHNIL